jgi:SHS2 domain-containing protein
VTAGPPGHEPLEHTSEEGVIARGSTLAEAFEQAAEGMYTLMLDLGGVAEVDERAIDLSGESHEALLVDWLLELLFLTETEGLVFRRFAVDELTDARLRGRAWGEPFDAERHVSNNVMVKAVTHHLLEIERENGCWRVQVLFDI